MGNNIEKNIISFSRRIKEIQNKEINLKDIYRALCVDTDCFFDGFNLMTANDYFNDSKYHCNAILEEFMKEGRPDFFQYYDLIEMVELADYIEDGRKESAPWQYYSGYKEKTKQKEENILDIPKYALLYTILVEPFYYMAQYGKENQ